jgi:hypothetical protein
LRCNAAPKEETLHWSATLPSLLCCVATQLHKSKREKKVKMLTWVARGSRSGSSHSSPAATVASTKLSQLQAPSSCA